MKITFSLINMIIFINYKSIFHFGLFIEGNYQELIKKLILIIGFIPWNSYHS